MSKAELVDRPACVACGSGNLVELSSGEYDKGAVGDFLRADPWGEDPMPFLAGLRWCFVRCVACGQAFHRRILSPEWNERRFSKWMSLEAIQTFEAAVDTPQRHFAKASLHVAHALRLEVLTRAARGVRPVRLLDFGCGNGEFVAMCNLHGFDAVGVDRSTARQSNSLVPIHAELDEVSGPFDVITMFEVLEHLDGPREMLEVLTKLISPGGILVLETPDCTGITDIKSLSDYRRIHPLEHINAFTPQTMQHLAERVGYDLIKRPVAHVTASRSKLVKTEVKNMLGAVLRPTTQLYFRRAAP